MPHFALFCAAFWKGWKLTLVMMSVLPLLAASGMAFGALLGKLSSKSSDAYARANSIVQQVCAGTDCYCLSDDS
jgi:ATP-binding cassette, subfamily B (MDR/TAP), member 1